MSCAVDAGVVESLYVMVLFVKRTHSRMGPVTNMESW
jgi:hypothetical protein